MSGICYIMGAGDYFPDKDCFVPDQDDIVIAADGGYLALLSLSIVPDCILGDMDSMTEDTKKALLSKRTRKGQSIFLHPARKDDTDMMLAIRYGLDQGYRTFYLYGGCGGRMDHTIANLQSLAYLAEHDAIGYLMGSQNVSTIIHNTTFTVPAEVDGYISVFAYGGTATGINYEGMSYPLTDATLTPFYPLGVSNQPVSRPCRITVSEGFLLVLWNR